MHFCILHITPRIVLFVQQQYLILSPFVMVNCIFESNVLIVIILNRLVLVYLYIVSMMIIIVSHRIWEFSWTTIITVRWAGNGPWTRCRFPQLPVVHLFIMHRLASVADGIPTGCDRLDAFSLMLLYNIRPARPT